MSGASSLGVLGTLAWRNLWRNYRRTLIMLVAIVKVKDSDEALRLSEDSSFGLGVTVCTTSTATAERIAEQVSDGAFFMNELVKSDSRLPFGGTKRSGYGRELSRDGILEFVNRKTVYLK